jgi:hypothetical protein
MKAEPSVLHCCLEAKNEKLDMYYLSKLTEEGLDNESAVLLVDHDHMLI